MATGQNSITGDWTGLSADLTITSFADDIDSNSNHNLMFTHLYPTYLISTLSLLRLYPFFILSLLLYLYLISTLSVPFPYSSTLCTPSLPYLMIDVMSSHPYMRGCTGVRLVPLGSFSAGGNGQERELRFAATSGTSGGGEQQPS